MCCSRYALRAAYLSGLSSSGGGVKRAARTVMSAAIGLRAHPVAVPFAGRDGVPPAWVRADVDVLIAASVVVGVIMWTAKLQARMASWAFALSSRGPLVEPLKRLLVRIIAGESHTGPGMPVPPVTGGGVTPGLAAGRGGGSSGSVRRG